MTARVHANEAYHQINDLPPLAEEFKSGEKLNAVEFAKSLGLDARGAGTSVEVWFVGRRGESSKRPTESLRMSAGGTSKDDEVVYLGQRKKDGEKLPLRLKDSFSDDEETPLE